MKIGRSYKQHGIPGDRYDAIVIGSGVGGLTCAGMLARHSNQRVLVLERHSTAGGFTHTFTRSGYEWDVGVHYVGEVNRAGTLLRRVFDHVTDGELGWEDLGETYDTIVIAGERYRLPCGLEAYRHRMYEYFPQERAAIDQYLEKVKKTVKRTKLYFMEKALPGPLSHFLGPSLRWPALRDAKKTVSQVLDGITQNPRLRAVLTAQYGDYGLPPSEASFFMHALVVEHYFGGAAYPIGGSSRIAETLLPAIERAGGAVVTLADVSEVLFERNCTVGVRLADGREIRADKIISDAGWAITFGRLVPAAIAAAAGIQVQVAGVGPSLSHVSLYVGLKKTAADLGLPRSNVWVYADDDHNGAIARYFADSEEPLPLTYLSFPSAKDPDFARRFPGKATIEVIGVAPYDWFSRWEETKWGKRGEEYEAFKAKLANRLKAALLHELPQVAGTIDHLELSTPLSTRNFVAHPHGEIYGLAHTPARFAMSDLRPKTRLSGLYLTGADVCTAGIGSALLSGVLTASVMTGRNLLKAILKAPDRQARRPSSGGREQ